VALGETGAARERLAQARSAAGGSAQQRELLDVPAASPGRDGRDEIGCALGRSYQVDGDYARAREAFVRSHCEDETARLDLRDGDAYHAVVRLETGHGDAETLAAAYAASAAAARRAGSSPP